MSEKISFNESSDEESYLFTGASTSNIKEQEEDSSSDEPEPLSFSASKIHIHNKLMGAKQQVS